MNRLHRLLVIAFLASVSAVLVQRGIYFYCQDRLGFTSAQNLWLGLGFGVTYIIGALLSHRAAVRLGDRKFLLLLAGAVAGCCGVLAVISGATTCVVMTLIISGLFGSTWPMLESYVSAGHGPKATAHALGKFGVAWALGVPIAMILSGQLIAWSGPALFAASALAALVAIVLIAGLEAHVAHLEDDHPERPPPELDRRYRVLVLSARWSLVGNYTVVFLLIPLIPAILTQLGLGVRSATAIASMLDIVRVPIFALLWFYHGWHGKTGLLIWAALSLPIGFFLVLLSPQFSLWTGWAGIATVIVGQLILGFGAAVLYQSALYYAMAVAASVESGGAHEAMIGSGFALGPAIGLIGVALANAVGGQNTGITIAVAPVMVVCLIGALWPMRKLAKPQAAYGFGA